jgi:hypothetical protein
MANWASVEELRSQINKASPLSDVDLRSILTAAENTINRFCHRKDGFLAATTASARTYPGSGNGFLVIDETPEITAVGAKESYSDASFTAWATTDWIAFSGSRRFPNFNATPYTGLMINPNGDYSHFFKGTQPGFPMVQITAKWGAYTTIPTELKEASIMQAARWFKRLEGAMSDALAGGELGTLLYRQSLDPDIKMILVSGRYVRPAVGGR